MPTNPIRNAVLSLAFVLAAPAAAQQPVIRPSIAPVERQVSAFEPIRVQWSNMPTSLNYASATLSPAGEDRVVSTKQMDLTTPERKRSGVVVFDGTMPGDYDVRVATFTSGSNYVVARTRITVFDPNQTIEPGDAQPGAPEPAPQPGGAGQPGIKPGIKAPVGGPTLGR